MHGPMFGVWSAKWADIRNPSRPEWQVVCVTHSFITKLARLRSIASITILTVTQWPHVTRLNTAIVPERVPDRLKTGFLLKEVVLGCAPGHVSIALIRRRSFPFKLSSAVRKIGRRALGPVHDVAWRIWEAHWSAMIGWNSDLC